MVDGDDDKRLLSEESFEVFCWLKLYFHCSVVEGGYKDVCS